MDFRAKNDRNKERLKVNAVKEVLKEYGRSLRLIDEVLGELRRNREGLDMLKAGWRDCDPVKGGGSSQEDRLCFVLDKNKELEGLVEDIKKDYKHIRLAIEGLDDEMLIDVVFGLWVYGNVSLRALAKKYSLSKSSIWRRSDFALLEIWKVLFDSGKV